MSVAAEPVRPPAMVRPAPRRRRAVALGALFVAMAVAMTFPNVSQLLSRTPGDLGDPLFTQWTMRWDFHALLTSPFDVFDPNIFWPAPNTLTYSDTLLAVAPVAGVLGAVLGWPLTYNVLYLGCWVASLACAYLLAHWVVGRRDVAVVAAFAYTFAAPRLTHFGHFQLAFGFLIPLGLWLLLRFLTERARWQAAALGVVLAAAFLQTVYYALILYVAVAVVVVGWLVAERGRPGRWFVTGLALAAAIGAVIAGPVAYKYWRHGDVLDRPYEHRYAAHPGDFLAPVGGSYLYGPVADFATRHGRTGETHLFPGLVAAGLAVVGGVGLWRSRGRPCPDERSRLHGRGVALLLIAGAVVFVLSFGRYQEIAGVRIPLPYRAVQALVPGFDAIRVPARFTVVPMLVVAVLAAMGLARLLAGRPERAARLAVVAVLVVMAAEYAIRIPTSPRVDRRELAAVNRALSRLPDGAVLEVPMPDPNQFAAAITEAPRMILATIDWKPRVNGYSGYYPPEYLGTVEAVAALGTGQPAPAQVVEELRRLQVRYVVIRLDAVEHRVRRVGVTHFDEAGAGRVVNALGPLVKDISRHGAALLVELQPWT